MANSRMKLEGVLLLASGLMICISILSLGGILLHKAVPEESRQAWTTVRFLLGTFGLHVSALALTHVFLRWHQIGWREFLGLIDVHKGRLLLVGLAAGLAVLPPTLGLKWACDAGLHFLQQQLDASGIEWLSLSPEEQAPVQMLQRLDLWPEYLWFGLSAIVLAPLVEEILFRGILFGFLRQCGRRTLGLWLSALFFAAIHQNLVTLLPLTLLGLFLAWLYDLSENLMVPIVCHATFNLVNFGLLIWLPPTP